MALDEERWIKIMKKLQMFGLALIVMSAFSALTVASASAEVTLLAEWLLNGAAIVVLTPAMWTREVLFVDPLGVHIVCSYILDGSVGPNGEYEITKVLTLAGVEVTLTATLLCKTVSQCEESATDIELSPEKLPFHGLIFLMENGTFLAREEGTFSLSCLVLGIKVSEECSSTGSTYEGLNVTGGVEVGGVGTPLWNCTGGAEKGEVEPLAGNLLTLTEGGDITLSSI